jgi:hypothetical protein
MKEEILQELYSLSDNQTKSNIGILLKRLENLNLSLENSLSFSQIKELYKNLIKDTLYEQNRVFKKIIKAKYEKGSIVYE